MNGLVATYEELKLRRLMWIWKIIKYCLVATYEELKYNYKFIEDIEGERLVATYEELKCISTTKIVVPMANKFSSNL